MGDAGPREILGDEARQAEGWRVWSKRAENPDRHFRLTAKKRL